MSNALQPIQEPNAIGGDAQRKFVVSDFEFGKKLGQGRFGTVFLGREKKNNFILAIKRINNITLTSDQTLLQMKREIELQYYLLHKNILLLYGFFDDLNHVYILLEACPAGTLFRALKLNGGLNVPRATYVVDCVADALNYCHDRHVIHRDVKPENILLTEEFVPKLADFGWAVCTEKKNRETYCGTPHYLSPEMLNSDNNHAHTFKIDNWALGVLYYECLTSQTPFYSKDKTMTFHNIKCARIRQHKHITAGVLNVITGLLTVDVEKRSELNDFRNDKFIRGQVEEYNTNMSVRRAAK
uniref:Aurora kinase n=1 Tax=Panagrellus redivivus TaxID=6233 RepID=A0A7E4W2V4_PANRE